MPWLVASSTGALSPRDRRRPVGTTLAHAWTVQLRFDRGTILVCDAPEGVDLSQAPGALWDARVQAYRAPARSHPALCQWLLDRRVEFTDKARTDCTPTAGWGDPGLRDYQAAALWAWELAGRRGVVVLPTGSGKTRVALAAMASTRRPALCLVPTRVLLDQWRQEITTVYPYPVGCFGDGRREVAPVTVCTYESAYRHMYRLGHRFDLAVVDEVHHFGCGFRDEALEMTLASARLGLTATPPRDPSQAARLAELVGPTVYELTIADLTGRFLASFDTITLHVDLTETERARYTSLALPFTGAYAAFRRTLPQATWADFARAAGRSAEGRRALSAWREARRLLALTEAKRHAVGALLDRHRDARVLVFTADNASAYAIAREHLVMPLTCDIGRQEREQVLTAFRQGQLRVLVSSRVLNEGLDVPDADVAVIAGGALGEREHVQRVGRLLRPGPGKRALVYELVTRQTIEVGQAWRRRQGLVARRSAQL
ncbi:MAG TPA: DEAD/DEAH box helicase family protein [Solirubrobacterales bacterium]|nr:DEAD/DEAH box helicase family protein [Solirubrobacterales bacterium]